MLGAAAKRMMTYGFLQRSIRALRLERRALIHWGRRMPNSYSDMMIEAAKVFPLRLSDESPTDVPALSIPLANRSVDSINSGEIAAIRSSLNPMRVEELVTSAMSRIAACMTLREKAHQLQVSATADALEYKAKSKILNAQRALEKMKKDIDPSKRDSANSSIDDIYDESINWNEGKRLASLDSGNGSNYSERYEFLVMLFDLNIRQAYARAMQASEGLKKVYGIDRPLPTLSGNLYLNELAIWAQIVSDDLDAKLDNEVHYDSAFALCSGVSDAKQEQVYNLNDYTTKLNAKVFDFALEPSANKNLLPNSRIRGLSINIITPDQGKNNKLSWNMRVRLPGQAFGCPILATTGDIGDFSLRDEVYNLSPYGDWIISIDPISVSGTKDLISNVVIHLDLVVERS